MKQVINSLFFVLVFRNLIFIQTFPVYPTFGTRIHTGTGIFVQLVILHEGNCLGSVRLHLKVAKGSIAEAKVLSALERGRLVKSGRMVVEVKGAWRVGSSRGPKLDS